MSNQEAMTVDEALFDLVISRFGVPIELHSNQGWKFESAIFQALMKLLGINKTRTAAFHRQSDGMVKRYNKTIVDYLAKIDQK